jgi:hypothetical protein
MFDTEENFDRLSYNYSTLDIPMVSGVSEGQHQCIKCRTYLCNCKKRFSHLYEKRLGTIIKIRNTIMTIKLDNGKKIFCDKLWGCGGGLSPRIIEGARVKVYHHDWKLFYRIVGQ